MMRALLPLLPAVLVLLCPPAQAQTCPEATAGQAGHLLGVTLGAGGVQLRDTNFNPTRYAGLMPGGRLEYRLQGCTERISAALGGSGATLQNAQGYPVLLLRPGLEAAWVHRLLGGELAPWRLWVGGALTARPWLYNFQVEDPDHVAWFTAYRAAARAVGELRPGGGWALSAALTLPVVALVSRPPARITYDSDKPSPGYLLRRIHDGLSLASWERERAVGLELAAEVPVGPRVSHRLSYRLDWASDAAPRRVQVLDHALAFTLLVRL